VSKIPDQNLILSLFVTLVPYRMLGRGSWNAGREIICPEKFCWYFLIKIIPLKKQFTFLCNDVF
jgi:hypothetical protein